MTLSVYHTVVYSIRLSIHKHMVIYLAKYGASGWVAPPFFATCPHLNECDLSNTSDLLELAVVNCKTSHGFDCQRQRSLSVGRWKKWIAAQRSWVCPSTSGVAGLTLHVSKLYCDVPFKAPQRRRLEGATITIMNHQELALIINHHVAINSPLMNH